MDAYDRTEADAKYPGFAPSLTTGDRIMLFAAGKSVIYDEEMDPTHPFWDQALLVINQLAPVTRRDDWWDTDGPKTIIFRALLEASKRRE